MVHSAPAPELVAGGAVDGGSVEEAVWELVMGQEVLQEMMATLGGH